MPSNPQTAHRMGTYMYINDLTVWHFARTDAGTIERINAGTDERGDGREQCDTVEADKGALSVACAHWPTNLSGSRRCALLRYVSEDGSPPPGLEVSICRHTEHKVLLCAAAAGATTCRWRALRCLL